ncbi:Hpt domain-containing protein [Hydrogenophaga sp.]|uniref:Hpt domain-containing protein n=1 Tax=Hydrogenophaga sp. TaxID=1904254 RepID=UPI0025BA4C01|nr:Hpt domain-containing protein [Hydrogenophaga sp.]
MTLYPIQYNAHKLKGGAMLLGFRAIVKTAELIEQLATDHAGPPLPTGLDMEATQLALRQFESASAV